MINAGPTQFQPGPVISTLQKVGLKTTVKGGKIEIMKDKVVAKAGDRITAEMVAVFNLLKIEPMEIGLNLKAMWEDGSVLPADVLVIDEQAYMEKFMDAIRKAMNLSVEAGYPTKENIEIMLVRAHGSARSVALEAAYPASGIEEELIAVANAGAKTLKEMLNV